VEMMIRTKSSPIVTKITVCMKLGYIINAIIVVE
jgi:hypothetical protein